MAKSANWLACIFVCLRGDQVNDTTVDSATSAGDAIGAVVRQTISPLSYGETNRCTYNIYFCALASPCSRPVSLTMTRFTWFHTHPCGENRTIWVMVWVLTSDRVAWNMSTWPILKSPHKLIRKLRADHLPWCLHFGASVLHKKGCAYHNNRPMWSPSEGRFC